MLGIFDEPKIDCHNHILDPVRFPYGADSIYRPSSQEIGTAAQFKRGDGRLRRTPSKNKSIHTTGAH